MSIRIYFCVNKTVTQSQNWHNTALLIVQVPWKSNEKQCYVVSAHSQRCSLVRGQVGEALQLHWCGDMGTLAELFGGEMFGRPTRKEKEDAHGGFLLTTPSLWIFFLGRQVAGSKIFDLRDLQEYWE